MVATLQVTVQTFVIKWEGSLIQICVREVCWDLAEAVGQAFFLSVLASLAFSALII